MRMGAAVPGIVRADRIRRHALGIKVFVGGGTLPMGACDGPPGDLFAEALMEAFGGLGGVYRHSLRHVYLASFLAVLGCFFSILILIAMRLRGQDGESAPGAE